MKIPAKVLENIQQNQALQIEWAGHRDIYEIVEEWTDGLFWLCNLLIAAYYLSYLIEFTFIVKMVLLAFCIISLIPALLESKKWASEWHIVTHDMHKGGGLYFKAEGILNTQLTPLDVMKVLPIPDEYHNNIAYWLWKKLTNHRLQKVTLKSDAGFFLLNNNRMPPQFANAWFRVRGPMTVTKPEDGIWHEIDQLSRQIVRNNYPERDGKLIIRHKIDNHFYGN